MRRRPVVLVVLAVLAAAFVAVVVFDVFGDDSDNAAPVEVARFCQLGDQLDQVSLFTGAASAPGVYDGPPEKIKAAVDQMGPALEELRSLAPKPVGGDVDAFTDAIKEAATGDPSAVTASGFAESVRRLSSYRTRNCGAGVGSGDG